MELIKGNKALAAELGVNNNTISKRFYSITQRFE